MKRFKFNLDKLLDLREFREKEAETLLGKALAELNSLETELQIIAQKKIATQSSKTQKLHIHDLVSIEHYLLHLETQKEELLEKLVIAKLEVEKAREKYLETLKDRKIITKFKEKKEKEWKKENQEEADIQLDDIINAKKY